MKEIAKMLCQAYVEKKSSAHAPEGFTELEEKFRKTLNQEQMGMYLDLEFFIFEIIDSREKSIVEYVLHLLCPEHD